MRAVLTASFLSIATVTMTSSAWSQQDLFSKCSEKTKNGDIVIKKEKFAALADNLRDPEFAKLDPDCLGKARNVQGVAIQQKRAKQATQRIVHDLNDVASAQPQNQNRSGDIPVGVARQHFGPPPEISLPFRFRDAYSTYSLLSPPPPKDRAAGMQISYTHDSLADNYILSGVGAVIAWDTLAIKGETSPMLASYGFTRFLFAPGFEFDQTRNHANPKKDTDYIAYKLTTELEQETPNGLFQLNYYRFAGYWKTDSSGESGIAGGYFQWEPYNLEFAIGVAPLIARTFQFRWAPILHVEGERVVDPGLLTLVKGSSYFRGGPILRADMFFIDGLLRNFVFGVQYRYLADLNSSSKDIKYFQASAAYNLDAAGTIALGVTYRDGMLPGNNTDVRDIKTGLTIKH